MIYAFPAVFDKGSDPEKGFTVTFPDLSGCITEGIDINEAMYMAEDALRGFLYVMKKDNEKIPCPSDSNSIDVPANGFVSVIEVQGEFLSED